MKRAAAFIASFLLAALPFGASAAGEQADAGSASEAARGKSIVVYFSASGNTRAAAEKIAELTGSFQRRSTPRRISTGMTARAAPRSRRTMRASVPR